MGWILFNLLHPGRGKMSFVNSGSQNCREKGDFFFKLRQKAGLTALEPVAKPQAACCPHVDRDLRTKWV